MRTGWILLMFIAILFLPMASGNDGGPDFNQRGSIVISGEEDLTGENGILSGNGSQEDPYLISRWWINVSKGDGIIIEDVNSHVLIYEVAVTHALNLGELSEFKDRGILIRNCSNIRIERCYVYYFGTGMDVSGSDNIAIHDSSVIENHNGIVMEADDSSITGCICSYNTRYGVFINNSDRLSLRDLITDSNSFTMGEGAGIQMINCSDIVMEECYGTLNYGEGISVIGSGDDRDLLIRDCYSDTNVNGIQVIDMDGVVIEGTRLRYNSYGVNLVNVKDARVTDCTFWKNSFGVIGHNLGVSLVEANRFEGNEEGLILGASYDNRIVKNIFTNTSKEAVRIKEDSGYGNVLVMNRFLDNNQGMEQVKDLSGLAVFSEGEKGNYWSDWQGNDTDGDGVVDAEKELPGGSVDSYPLSMGRQEDTHSRALPADEDDERGMEYWIIVTISAMATLILAFIIIYNRRTE